MMGQISARCRSATSFGPVSRPDSVIEFGPYMLRAAGESDDVTGDARQRHQHQDDHETYCETETFNATCDAPGDVILVTHALYGRMQLSRCTKIDYGHIGCSSDVTELADARCSGRQACEIAIPDALFAKSQPCPEDLKPYLEDLKPYLEVGYTCLSGKQSARSRRLERVGVVS